MMAVNGLATYPGVYINTLRDYSKKISLTERTLPGFAGIARKGPVNEPVYIRNFNHYMEIFGDFNTVGYLPYSVYSFFNCGGDECYVIRIAHLKKDGLTASTLNIPSIISSGDLRVQAASMGTWGNNITLRIWHIAEESHTFKDAVNSSGRKIRISLENCSLGDILRVAWEDGFMSFHRITRQSLKDGSLLISGHKPNLHIGGVETIRFNVSLTNEKFREDFLYLTTKKDDSRFFLNTLKQSRLIRLEEDVPADWFPAEVGLSSLSQGRDGVLNLTAGDFIGHFNGLNDHSGLCSFRSLPEINLLSAPDIPLFSQIYQSKPDTAADFVHAVQRAMIDQAEEMGNRIALLDAPDCSDEDDLIRMAKCFDSSHAALYYPEIEILDPRSNNGSRTLFIPPSGSIAGIIAQCDKEEGSFRAPAGITITGAVGLKHAFSQGVNEVLFNAGLNGFKRIPGRGIKVWGARTLSSDPEWKHLNVRRTFIRLCSAIQDGLGWAVFEPNTSGLRKRVVRHVSAFLIDMWRKGYLAGKTPEEAFLIICNEELNPPENIDAGIITIQIGLSITRPAEYLAVTLKATKDGVNVMIEEAS